MNRNLKQFIILLAQSVFFWILAFLLLMIFRYYGLQEEDGNIIAPEFQVPITQWIDISLYIGLSLGLLYAVIEFTFGKFIVNKVSLGVVLIFKSFIYLIVMVIIISLATYYAEYRMDIDLNNDMGWWRTNKAFWVSVLYFFISSLVFSFIKIANDKFGRGVFLNMLLGKYRKPREEKRILMFLDLKDSTMIAERLGHIKYSQFIQDCFIDLNRVLNKYEAEIYQYVGDEAVLSWTFKRGLKQNNCIYLFDAFQKRLKKRASYYNDVYDQVPEFKAGLHGGQLMIAEVGIIKKELAYHGDVINTTSRIQSECNKYLESLLISKDLLQQLSMSSKFQSHPIGEVALKGRKASISISAIRFQT